MHSPHHSQWIQGCRGIHEPGSILGTEQFHILGCRRSLFLSSQTAAVKATAILLSLLSVGFHSLRVRK
jgi:hypothetical protein